jgi:hypothetical protein
MRKLREVLRLDTLGPALVTAEIWLHPDGTLHEYREELSVDSARNQLVQRYYVGAVGEESISVEAWKQSRRSAMEYGHVSCRTERFRLGIVDLCTGKRGVISRAATRDQDLSI